MIVDLDIFDANVRRLADYARSAGKKLRLATKSVRVPELIRRAVEVGGEDVMQGLMCFSAKEVSKSFFYIHLSKPRQPKPIDL